MLGEHLDYVIIASLKILSHSPLTNHPTIRGYISYRMTASDNNPKKERNIVHHWFFHLFQGLLRPLGSSDQCSVATLGRRSDSIRCPRAFHLWRYFGNTCVILSSPSCCRMFSFRTSFVLLAPSNSLRNVTGAAPIWRSSALPRVQHIRCHTVMLVYWPRKEFLAACLPFICFPTFLLNIQLFYCSLKVFQY
jgi:hypothetical protein